MMIVMQPDATEEEVHAVAARVQAAGGRAHRVDGDAVTLVGAIGETLDRERLWEVAGEAGVDRVVPISEPFKLASRQMRGGAASTFDIDGVRIGGGAFATIAGPCTVESREQTLETARIVAEAGTGADVMFRGGAYKPRTSPYGFHGLGRAGLEILREAKAETGLPIVTELMDVRELDEVLEVADVVQVGARNMQNYTLLTEIGRSGRPTLIKRGLSSTLEELLMAAEYVLKEGTTDVLLCERGIRTFEPATRFTLDVSAVPVLKERTHLPVVVDPSHAPGRRDLVLPLSLAAAAAGADGIIVETHPNPEEALCDGPQQIRAAEFATYLEHVRAAAAVARGAFAAAV